MWPLCALSSIFRIIFFLWTSGFCYSFSPLFSLDYLSIIIRLNTVMFIIFRLIPIDNCHAIFINVTPANQPSAVTPRPKRVVSLWRHKPQKSWYFVSMDVVGFQLSSLLSTEWQVCESGGVIARKMLEVCMQTYNLCSTTVTGIPMKVRVCASVWTSHCDWTRSCEWFSGGTTRRSVGELRRWTASPCRSTRRPLHLRWRQLPHLIIILSPWQHD